MLAETIMNWFWVDLVLVATGFCLVLIFPEKPVILKKYFSRAPALIILGVGLCCLVGLLGLAAEKNHSAEERNFYWGQPVPLKQLKSGQYLIEAVWQSGLAIVKNETTTARIIIGGIPSYFTAGTKFIVSEKGVTRIMVGTKI